MSKHVDMQQLGTEFRLKDQGRAFGGHQMNNAVNFIGGQRIDAMNQRTGANLDRNKIPEWLREDILSDLKNRIETKDAKEGLNLI